MGSLHTCEANAAKAGLWIQWCIPVEILGPSSYALPCCWDHPGGQKDALLTPQLVQAVEATQGGSRGNPMPPLELACSQVLGLVFDGAQTPEKNTSPGHMKRHFRKRHQNGTPRKRHLVGNLGPVFSDLVI